MPVGLSNSLWMYCAFLGVARPWNFTISLLGVLEIACVLFMIATIVTWLALRFAARDEPQQQPDWIDSMKARLSDRMPLGERRRYERPQFQDTLF